MKHILPALSLLFCNFLFAQKTVDVSKSSGGGIEAGTYYAAGNAPFVNTKYVNLIEGTPYFTEHWLKGAVKIKTGLRFSGSPLRYDLVNKKLHFLGKDGTELLSNIEPTEMWLEDTLSGKKYHFLQGSILPATNAEANEWYERVDSGRVHLYRVFSKVYSESLPYNSSVHEQRIITREKYYLLQDSKLVLLKNIKDLPDQLKDQKEALEAFIKKNDTKSVSTGERWQNIIRYYNSL